MSLRVIVAGPLATVQDSGRFGHRAWGVPISGPFDRRSAAIANALLGNVPGTAVVELTGFGGIYEAEGTLAVALAGATMPARVDRIGGPPLDLLIPAATTLRSGDRLSIGGATDRHRAYLAAIGGWHVPELMGSRASERPLRANDLLPAGEGVMATRRTHLGRIAGGNFGHIRYLDGPDADRIGPSALERSSYRVGRESDRMGLRLEGDVLPVRSDPNRLSAPVAPGTIQMAGGLPMILGPACGTMGGYPHVGQVISPDLDRLGQCRPGDEIRFRRVEMIEARELDRSYREDLARIVAILRM